MHMSEDNSNEELNCLVPVITPGGSDWTLIDVAMPFLEKNEINTKPLFQVFKSSCGSQLGMSEDMVCKSKKPIK